MLLGIGTDGAQLFDVVAVLVGEHDGVEVVGVLADCVDHAGHRASVHQDGPVAHREIGVARERVGVLCDVVDGHGS